MSKSKNIVDQGDALGIYFDEMLLESPPDTLKKKATSPEIKHAIDDDESSTFQVLLFDINGLQLAILTHDIKAILPWPETSLEPTKNATSNDLIMGLYTQESTQIKIIDTAKIVLPIEHQHNIAQPSFIVIVGEGQWALSCHKINTVITLLPKEIHWRKNSGARPWLAATSIEKGCSIINMTELVNLVNSQVLA